MLRQLGLSTLLLVGLSSCSQADRTRGALTAALADFSRRTNTSSLEEGGVILIRSKTYAWQEGEFGGLKAMDNEKECRAHSSAYESFVKLNRQEMAADQLFFSNAKWRLANTDELDQMPILTSTSDGQPFKTMMSLYAPGFSSDGKQAFVFLAFSWSIHGARASYVLEDIEGSWRVKCSQLNFFA
jgi:hypothetical protein